MPRPSDNPRCKCCDEVMEELLTIRQTFEKLFHKLTKQVVELRREVTNISSNGSGNGGGSGSGKNKRRAEEERCSPGISSPPPSKFKRYENNSESETECIELKAVKKEKSKKHALKEEIKDPVEVPKNSRPVLDFFNIQARVMPVQPFKTADQFEDWNAIFKEDEDQCDALRVELLQGQFDEPDKYIKHIWASVLKNEAAEHYSYRGQGRCNKRAIKNYIFTDIFRECFLQRFHHMDAVFFMERTMRFFNYAHDHKRKTIRNLKKKQSKNDSTQNEELMDNDMNTQDNQSFHGYDSTMLDGSMHGSM